MATDPPKKPRAKKRTYDWIEARRLFVEGLPTEDADARADGLKWVNLRQLAEHLDYSYDQMRRHAAAEDWASARADYIGNVERARQAERIANLARQAVDLDQRALATAAIGLGLAQRTARVMAQRAIDAQEAHGQDAAAMMAALDPGAQAVLALAARRWHEVGLRAMGRDSRHIVHTGPDGGPLPEGGTVNILAVPRGDSDRFERVAGLLAEAGTLALELPPVAGVANGNGNGHVEVETTGEWYADLTEGLDDLEEDEGDDDD